MNQVDTPNARTQTWINQIVIGQNLCPFARDAREQTHIIVSKLPDLDTQIEWTLTELTQAKRAYNNILIVIPEGLDLFEDFWEVCEMLEQNLEASGVLPYVQLAHFHPEYCFDGLEPTDRANWTNRSPYPTLHFLCAQTVETRIHKFSENESIPERNIRHLNALTQLEFQQLFQRLV